MLRGYQNKIKKKKKKKTDVERAQRDTRQCVSMGVVGWG